MINIATRFKAFRALITIMLSLPYWLGEPFKFDSDYYSKYMTQKELKEKYSEKYWNHFGPRIGVSFGVLILLSSIVFTVPFGILILLAIFIAAAIICLMVDVLIWLCRLVYQKIDETEKEIEAKEFGEENLPVPLDYYKDTSFLVLMKKRIENEKKTKEQNQSRINEFHQQRQNLSNGQPI